MQLFEPVPTMRGQMAMDTDGETVKVGQHWRDDLDGYVVRVVGFAENGWPVVRHVNARQGGHMVNPAWFGKWTKTKGT
jgi:hypothetical protein